MTSRNTLQEEVLSLALNAAFFGAWFLAFLVVKDLILAEYRIGPSGVTAALVAALVVAKVVLLLEHVELGSLVQSRAAWVEVALRTALYAIGALVVLAKAVHDGVASGQDQSGAVLEGVDMSQAGGKPLTRWDGRTTKPHPVTGEEVPDETARVLSFRYLNPKKAEWPEAGDYFNQGLAGVPFFRTPRPRWESRFGGSQPALGGMRQRSRCTAAMTMRSSQRCRQMRSPRAFV